MSGVATLAVLRREAATTQSNIQGRCQSAIAKDFPDAFPEQFLEVIHDIAGLLGEEIEAVAQDATIQADDKTRRVLFLLLHLRQISEWVRFADSAESSQTPWSIVGPLKTLFSPIIERCEFVVRPKWHWSYEILRGIPDYLAYLVRKAIEERPNNQKIIQRVREEVTRWGANGAVISFPYLDRENVLRHILFGHEVGHLVTDRCLGEYWRTNEDSIKNFLREAIHAKKLQADPSLASNPLLLFAIVGPEMERAHQFLRRAAEEILCDLTAVWVFGAIAVFAAYEIAVVHQMDIPPSEKTRGYPPWRYRLHWMVKNCSSDWLDQVAYRGMDDPFLREVHTSVRVAWDELQRVATVDLNNYKPLQGGILPIVYRYLSETILTAVVPKQREHVISRLPPLQHQSERTADLLKRLESDIPPNNIGVGDTIEFEVADLREIFLAGWLFYVFKMSTDPTFPGDATKQDKLNRLILKAVESSELESDYRAWRDKQCPH